MTRPLLSKLSAELEEAVNRNRNNRAELELIISELSYRKTTLARKIELSAKTHLERLTKPASEPAAIGSPAVLFAGKYETVHTAAMAAGSPVIIGWPNKERRFIAGKVPRGRISSVYAAIQRIAAAAGDAGLTGAELATRLRTDQTGNPRSEYCAGLPPIGWAEGWIHTAIQKRLIVEKRSFFTNGDEAKLPKSTGHQSATQPSLEDLNEQMADSWHDLVRLRQLDLPLNQCPDAGKYLRDRLAQRIVELEQKTPTTREPPPASSTANALKREDPATKANRKNTEMSASSHSLDVRTHTEQAVAQLRTKLIDLTRRSPLISFKHGGRTATLLRIVDERPDLVFDILNRKGVGFDALPDQDVTPKDETTDQFRLAYENAMLTDETFLAATEKLGDDEHDAEQWQRAERALRTRIRATLGLPLLDYGKGLDITALARAHGFDTSFDLKASGGPDVAAHHEDDRLRVLLIEKDLEKRLKSIWDKYRSHERETGLHTLFLVFGFVQWHDDQTGDDPHFAPALLQAITMERKVSHGRYEYVVRPHDDGLQINVALAEKLRQHMGLEMPELREDETPEAYFVRLDEILSKGKRLKLRRFLTLAVLPFPQMVLWKDLDPDLWTGAFARHRLLPSMLGAAPMGGDPSPRDPYDIDAPEWANKAPVLIRPADASQHSALIEAAEGHDLAVEGPPGTGKSETITNMIATALDQGKKVLFVAEKQAALRVVADRLRASGFGPLLLELHGDTARREDVYKGIKERIDARLTADPQALERARAELAARRDRIRNYLRLIRTPLGALGLTAYAATWRDINLRNSLPSDATERHLALFPISKPTEVTPGQLSDVRSSLKVFAEALDELDRASAAGLTNWLFAGRLPVFDHKSQLALAGTAASAAHSLDEADKALRNALGFGLPGPREDLKPIMTQFENLPALSVDEEPTLVAALNDGDAARSLLRQQVRWRQLVGKLELDVAEPATASGDAISALGNALSGLPSIPVTPADNNAKLSALLTGRETLLRTKNARHQLSALLGLSPDLSVAAQLKVYETLKSLDDFSPAIKALMRGILLDPLIEMGMAQEGDRARTLCEEKAALLDQFHDTVLDADQDELNRLAEVLDSSGWFARVFGSQFKAARKRSAQVLRDQSQRDQMADALRKMSRHLRNAERFDQQSAAREWFPAIMWLGAGADFASLNAARQALQSARDSLTAAGSRDVLNAWLGLDAEKRALAASLAREDAPALASLVTAGFGSRTLPEEVEELDRRITQHQELQQALQGVRAHDAGQIVRDDENLADRLAGLRSAENEFAAVCSRPHFGWVGPISQTLEPLARALSFADAIAAVDDPLSARSLLRKSSTPAAMWTKLCQLAPSLIDAARSWIEASQNLEAEAELNIHKLPAENADGDWADFASILGLMADDLSGARLVANLRKYEGDLRERGFDQLVQAVMEKGLPARHLPDLYELSVISKLLRHYLNGDGQDLARLGTLTLKAAQEAFVHTDKQLHKIEAERIVAKQIEAKAPWGIDYGRRGQWTDMALLDNELSLTRPRTSLRDVVHRAGKALQTLKPVWMMSPASVAQYIRPGSLEFDVLVIDEASQMRPEFAISAVMRGKQFVVVGDANQLPPSDHFQLAGPVDDNVGDGVGIDAATESILDLANQRFRKKRRLRCAYRFQHERLINFSNREFYESDLVVFPSPRGEDDDLLGVRYVYVPEIHPDTVYEASINQREAQAVIEEAYRLMITYPEHSLGIAAMNAKQTELIQNEFDRLVLERPEVRRYVEQFAGKVDEFFIKNLENVQGDERDIILVSTVYGPDKAGIVKQNFGLMSREVGWRRLNVLVTRAKMSTRVFTSLRPEDIKVTETSSKGPRALKAYLTYALGGATADESFGGEPDSDFEVFVADRLRAAGYIVVPQVGVDRFRIDLGVKHADYGGGFLAGIECDGAPFHSGLTVRDRDRIRQAQLESLGWHIYRIWSVDWFLDPGRQMELLLGWLARLRDVGIARLPARPKDEKQNSALVEAVQISTVDDARQLSASQPVMSEIIASSVEIDSSPRAPIGKAMTPLDGIVWYAEDPGKYYTVWNEGELVGDVMVLSRPTSSAGIYGGQLRAPKPEYEGSIERTQETFKTHDIYHAVREVMRRGLKDK